MTHKKTPLKYLRGVCVKSRIRFPGLGGWNLGNGFENSGTNLVRITLRVRTTIFQVTLVAIVDEAVRHANGSASISDTLSGNVLLAVFLKRIHEFLEVVLTAHLTHVRG